MVVSYKSFISVEVSGLIKFMREISAKVMQKFSRPIFQFSSSANFKLDTEKRCSASLNLKSAREQRI